MGYYKFVCNWQTERACFYHRLFGNGSEYVRETDSTLDVEEDDTLFLHRYNSTPNRHGYLYGPFTAVSDAQKDLVEDPWGFVGAFPWQVRVSFEEPVYSRSLRNYREQAEDPPTEVTGYAQAFTEVEGLYLKGVVNDGDQIL